MVIVRENILCLHYADLKRFGYTDQYLWKVTSIARKDTAAPYQPVDDKQGIAIVYNSIPAKAITERAIPSEQYWREEYQKQQIASRVPFSDTAYNYYLSNPTTAQYARELAEQASWLIYLANTAKQNLQTLSMTSVDEVYSLAMKLMCGKEWKLWECTSLQVFRRKLKPFLKVKKISVLGADAEKHSLVDALKSLTQNKVLSKLNNSNRTKLGAEQEALLVQIHGDGHAKPPIEHTFMLYLRRAQEYVQAGKWPETSIVSLTTVRNFLMRPDIQQVWYSSRHGYQEYRDKFEIVTHREKASMANALWISDNTRIHRTYYDPKKKGGVSRVTFTVVMDAHSWVILGFFISASENTQSMANTYRVACELSRYMPHQVQTDNGPAYSSAEGKKVLHALAKYVTPAAVGNARAKKIEAFFHQFNSQVLRYRKGYTPSPTTFTLDNRPNTEALAALVKSKELPLVDDVIREMYEDVSLWNNHIIKKYSKTPLQLYKESIEKTQELQRIYTPEIERAAFFIRSQYTYRKEGFKISRKESGKTIDYLYRVDMPAFNAQYIGTEFTCEYDPRDLNKGLWLYLNDKPVMIEGKHIVALPARLYHESLLDYAPGEAKALEEHRNQKKEQRQISNKRFVDYVGVTISNGSHTEVITENAFDKETLREAQSLRIEQMTNDNYSITEREETPVEVVKSNEKKIRREDL